jgi:hypothetical protein
MNIWPLERLVEHPTAWPASAVPGGVFAESAKDSLHMDAPSSLSRLLNVMIAMGRNYARTALIRSSVYVSYI